MPLFIFPYLVRKLSPVKAISKDEKGIEHIDESKCIYCGKCLNACPFGAIFEISQVFDVLHRIRKGEQVVAIVAPSILGQFKTTIEQVYGALNKSVLRMSLRWLRVRWIPSATRRTS